MWTFATQQTRHQENWDDHAIDGYYIEISRENYQCYKIWVKNTKSIWVADTVFFKHKYITVPNITKADAILAASTQLIKMLQGEIWTNIGKQEEEQLTRLAITFHTIAKKMSKTDSDKQSINSCHYNIQSRVGKTPLDQSIKNTLDLGNQPALMQMGNKKQHNNTLMLQLTSKQKEMAENIVASTTAASQQPNVISQKEVHQSNIYNQPVDNTWSKRTTPNLMQEGTLAAMEH